MNPARAVQEKNTRSVMELKLKKDKFRKSRGGRSRWLSVSCEKCKTPILIYQKDGPGILKRLYIDRIVLPVPSVKNLTCSKCKTLLGVRMVYKKENRFAYRLFAGAVGKKIVKAEKLPK